MEDDVDVHAPADLTLLKEDKEMELLKILADLPEALMHARVKLILVTQQVLKNVLGILGVDAPEKM